LSKKDLRPWRPLSSTRATQADRTVQGKSAKNKRARPPVPFAGRESRALFQALHFLHDKEVIKPAVDMPAAPEFSRRGYGLTGSKMIPKSSKPSIAAFNSHDTIKAISHPSIRKM
jgi:hypothetical protein